MMIVSYFTISKVVLVTQAFKASVRTLLTIWAIIILIRLSNKGFLTRIEYTNRLSIWFYIVYLLLGVASFMWSTNVYFSVLQWLMIVQSLIFAYFFFKLFIIYNWYYPSHHLRLTNVFSVAIFIISLILIVGAVVAPNVFFRATHGGEESRLGGYLMNPNELGMLTSLGSAVSLLELPKVKRKSFVFLILAVNIIALALTTSRSSFIGFLIVVAIIINRTASTKLKLAAFGLIVLAIPPILQYVIFKQGNVDEVLSMTGRLPFWKALLNEGIVKEPWLGFGFQRIYYTDHFVSLFAYPGMMTHNAFLQVLMNLGFVGFSIAIMQLIFTIRGVISIKNIEYKNIFIAFIIPLLINSMTEFGIYGNANYAIFFYQLLIFMVVQRPKTHFTQTEIVKDYTVRSYFGLPPSPVKRGEPPISSEEIIEKRTMI